MAIISATPTPERGCDTSTVQVYPTARSCPQVRSDLLRDGTLTDELAGMPLIHSSTNFEHLLLPAPGNGCVIVAVGIGIGAPKQQAAQAPAPAQQQSSQKAADPEQLSMLEAMGFTPQQVRCSHVLPRDPQPQKAVKAPHVCS